MLRNCIICGAEFAPVSRDNTCSTACRVARRRQRNRRRRQHPVMGEKLRAWHRSYYAADPEKQIEKVEVYTTRLRQTPEGRARLAAWMKAANDRRRGKLPALLQTDTLADATPEQVAAVMKAVAAAPKLGPSGPTFGAAEVVEFFP